MREGGDLDLRTSPETLFGGGYAPGKVHRKIVGRSAEVFRYGAGLLELGDVGHGEDLFIDEDIRRVGNRGYRFPVVIAFYLVADVYVEIMPVQALLKYGLVLIQGALALYRRKKLWIDGVFAVGADLFAEFSQIIKGAGFVAVVFFIFEYIKPRFDAVGVFDYIAFEKFFSLFEFSSGEPRQSFVIVEIIYQAVFRRFGLRCRVGRRAGFDLACPLRSFFFR